MTLAEILNEAQYKAHNAARAYYKEKGEKDWFPCGFAWVNARVKGNTKIGRELLASGMFRKAYGGGLQWWNPSGLMVQNMDTLLAGARAAADVLVANGIPAYAGSRMD